MISTAATIRELIDSAAPARQVAPNIAGLSELIPTLLDRRQDTRVRLGGNLFDVVVSGGGAEGRIVATVLDEAQGRCGPVIHDPDRGWLYWLVPPGSSRLWAPHTHGVCIGAPHTITVPPLDQVQPPGPHWLRPCAGNRLVPTPALRELLSHLRPEPSPHTALVAHRRRNSTP
ncbi:hypothetical protein [Streptomyces sp. NPDC051572]|uniref:hypothetical protein n=1 Tax=Streptomyces sp. NPDC051572 TaxID=3155802 RepID=UPI00344D9465